MDRRHQQHRPVLVWLGWLGVVGLSAVALAAGEISAQTNQGQEPAPPAKPETAHSAPAGTATPWVQASTPPGTAAQNQAASPVPPSPGAPKADKPANPPAVSEKPGTANPPPKPAVTPAPNVAPKLGGIPPGAANNPAQNQNGTSGVVPGNVAQNAKLGSPPKSNVPSSGPALRSADEIKAKLLREQREPGVSLPPEDALLPEEKRTFEENAIMYNRLPREEQGVIRRQAGERIREETASAYLQSGLDLSEDQREVFALRFRQERRRLEREIQEKASKERGRRLPQIIEQLRKEFGRLNEAPNSPKVQGTPGGSLSTPPPAVPESGAQQPPAPAAPSAAANPGTAKRVAPSHS